MSQKNISESSLSQLSSDFILPKATSRIKILTFGCIEYSFVLEVFEIIFEVLCSIWVEKSELKSANLFFNIIEGQPFMGDFHLMWLAVVTIGLVDEDLD